MRQQLMEGYRKGLQFNDSATHRDGNRLSAIVRAELIHDVLEVNLDGFLGYEKPIGNLFIPIACCHQSKDLHFP